MDLAHYCVNAVLVEGRSVRDVAAATGRSKSWVHRPTSSSSARAERRPWCPSNEVPMRR
jgi:transposase